MPVIGGASRREQRMSYRSSSSRAAAFDQALREAMSAPVTDRIQPEDTPAADPSAGTPSPEGVAPYNVAREHIIPKPTPYPDDGNSVEHGWSVGPPVAQCEHVNHRRERCVLPITHFGPHRSAWAQRLVEAGEKHYLPQAEFERQARLRRWQAVDPRERRT